jgi:hypothetical protein
LFVASGLKSASELHRAIAKQMETLAESFQKDFDQPLQRNYQQHSKKVDENEKQFDKTMRKIQDEITKTENRMLKDRKKNLFAFQQSLQDMQKQAQELEKTRLEQVHKMMADEERNFTFLVQKLAQLLKSEYEFYSGVALLSRSVTEDLICQAFAPCDRQLDANEKKKVIDKFLGTTENAVASANNAADVSKENVATSASNAPAPPPVGRKLTINSVSGASVHRPVTPPVSPSEISVHESLRKLSMSQRSVIDEETDQQQQYEQEQHYEAPVIQHQHHQELDLVIAIHDFNARTERELSFRKHDVLIVKQRQENWLYACHRDSHSSIGKSGWIPVSFTAKYTSE